MAGRATPVQSTISTIPSYAMQSARLPRSLCDEIDRKARRFLWRALSIIANSQCGLGTTHKVKTSWRARL